MRSKTQGERTSHTCQYDFFLSITLVTSFTQTHAYQMYRMCKESGGKNRQHLILDRIRYDQMMFCHFKNCLQGALIKKFRTAACASKRSKGSSFSMTYCSQPQPFSVANGTKLIRRSSRRLTSSAVRSSTAGPSDVATLGVRHT